MKQPESADQTEPVTAVAVSPPTPWPGSNPNKKNWGVTVGETIPTEMYDQKPGELGLVRALGFDNWHGGPDGGHEEMFFVGPSGERADHCNESAAREFIAHYKRAVETMKLYLLNGRNRKTHEWTVRSAGPTCEQLHGHLERIIYPDQARAALGAGADETQEPVHWHVNATCPCCDGSGMAALNATPGSCGVCRGSGRVDIFPAPSDQGGTDPEKTPVQP